MKNGTYGSEGTSLINRLLKNDSIGERKHRLKIISMTYSIN